MHLKPGVGACRSNNPQIQGMIWGFIWGVWWVFGGGYE
jgi:hypothetical protein